MFRTIYAVIVIIISVLVTLPRLRRMKSLPETMTVEEKDHLVHKTPDLFGRRMMGASGSKVEVKGLENMPQGPVLIVSNHQSNFDIPLLMGYLQKPIGFVSKAEIKKLPFVSSWMELMHSVFMERDNRRQSLQAIRDGIQFLKDGHSLVIFPEGTRSKQMKMNEFKTGSFHLAVKSGVPIVPVTINGTYKILEENGNRIKPAHVKLTISKPIYEQQYNEMDLKELAAYTQQVISSQLS